MIIYIPLARVGVYIHISKIGGFKLAEEVNELSNYFKELYGIDVSGRTFKKKDLTYLSWSSAWAELKKKDPNATYELKKFEKEIHKTRTKRISETETETVEEITKEVLPYAFDDTGLVVYTSVTAFGVTHEMHLTVMDGANKAMKHEAYTYKTKYGDKAVEAVSMFDVSKTIMRCLTKNIGLHGIGLNLYEKEMVPSVIVDLQKLQNECTELIKKKAGLSPDALAKVGEVCKELLPDENGDPKLSEDEEVLKALRKRLLGIRK